MRCIAFINLTQSSGRWAPSGCRKEQRVSVWCLCFGCLAVCSTTEKKKKIKKIDNAINIVKDEV